MKKQILAKFSPWLLAAACTLLALIIGVFAFSNYQREKRLMTEALLQQGLTINRFVTSSARASFSGSFRNIQMAMGQWSDHVQQAIDYSVDQPGLHFLALVNGQGTILASTQHADIGKKLDASTRRFSQSIFKSTSRNGAYLYRKISKENGEVFQLVTNFNPLGRGQYDSHMSGRGPMLGRQSPRGSQGMGQSGKEIFEQLRELEEKDLAILIEFDLAQYNTAVRRQLVQIVFLSLVLLLVGAGGWLSLLALQGLKGSQVRLRQIRQYTDLLVSSLPVGLIATGSDGAIRIFNQAAEDMVGIPVKHALGSRPETILAAELVEELQRAGNSRSAAEQKEITLTCGATDKRSLMVLGLPVHDSDNRFAGNTLLLQDVSDLKKLQEELRRNERLAALGKMAAGVAHELRNPLSSIKGLALLLKAKIHNDSQATGTADILVQEVERLNRSIGELLDYARPHKLELEPVRIDEALSKAVSLLEPDFNGAGVTLHTDYAEKCTVQGDRDKLNQVFLNLLLNALQAMENGGNLKITTTREDEDVICEIEDTGCGLEEENVAKVFDPYFTTKSDGTGLGLAMSVKIVEEHSGSMEFRSALGQGTVVKICLPAYFEEI